MCLLHSLGIIRKAIQNDISLISLHAIGVGNDQIMIRALLVRNLLSDQFIEETHLLFKQCQHTETGISVDRILQHELKAIHQLLCFTFVFLATWLNRAIGHMHQFNVRSIRRTETPVGFVVLDRVLCRGDVGGPVVDDGGKTLVGIQSRRRGPRTSPRKETVVTRFDTTPVRQLFEQAKAVAEGADVAKLAPVTCSAK